MTLTASAPAPRHPMIVWTPALLNTLITITGFVTVSIVALGQWQIYRQRGWKDAADARDAIIDTLKLQLDEAKAERAEMEQRLAAAEAKHEADTSLLEVRMQAWEAQVAQLQRVNYHLQQKLDAADARHAAIDARAAEREALTEARHTVSEAREVMHEARNLAQHPRDAED